MAVPPNDNLVNATAVTLGARIALNTADATLENGEPSTAVFSSPNNTPAVEGDKQNIGTNSGSVGHDIWYRYTPTPTTAGSTTISTDGSSYDTILVVYRLTDPTQPASYANFTRVVGNDDDGFDPAAAGGTSSNSTVLFNSQPGTTYYVQVAGYGSGAGDLRLSVSRSAPVPVNDDITNATPIGNGTNAGTNFALNTNRATLAEGEATRAPSSDTIATSPVGRDVWYSYRPATTGTVTATTDGSNFDTVLSVYRLTDPTRPPSYGNLTPVTGNDDDRSGAAQGGNNDNSTVNFTGQPGTTYYIQASGFSSASGDLSLSLTGPDADTLCFGAGTRLRVKRAGAEADMAVEDLRIGDMAVTACGDLRPIRWIGCRDFCRGTEALPIAQQPIRVRHNTFGPGLPERDLILSPGHPVLVGADADGEGGHLVPIMCLINGTTIEREAIDEVTYWHVELDAHDILLAEGLPCESYIDLGSRAWFAGADGALYDPDTTLRGMPGRCRPVAIDGPVVEAERRRLDGVFVTRLVAACAWPSTQEVFSI